MNSLNLRVSTIKTGENVKKNSEIRESPVTLPNNFQGDKTLVAEFLKQGSIPNQIQFVKQTFSFSNSDENRNDTEFFTNLYFNTPLKHPVRNQISKLLQKHPNSEKITQNLTNSIEMLIVNSSLESNISVHKLNLVVTSISGCFENFHQAKLAFGKQLKLIIPFLWNSLQRYLNELSNELSPSAKNEYYLYIHNVLRVFLSATQEFSEDLAMHQSTYLNLIIDISREIILDPEIPMDIKTNLGILKSYIAKGFKEYYLLIDEIFDKPYQYLYNLCVGIGIINTMTNQDFNEKQLQIEKMVLVIIGIGNKHSTEPSILLAASRSLLQISKKLLIFDTQNLSNLLESILDFIYSHLEHHMDSVRHICKDLFRNLLKIMKDYQNIMEQIFSTCNSKEMVISTKCIILSNVAIVLGSQIVLENFPNIFMDLFKKHLKNDLNVQNCYESLMLSSHKELEFDTWRKLWIDFLFNSSEKISECDNELIDNVIIEKLINKAIKLDSQLVECIMEDKNCSLDVKLSALWIIRKNDLKGFKTIKDSLEKFKTDYVKQAFLCNSNDSKIMALRFLVETHKATEPFTNLDFELLLLYLRYNSNIQSPSAREKTVGLYVKLLDRFQLNLKKILKDQIPNQNNKNYFKFLTGLLEILLDNLFDGANFSRRSMSLQLILHALENVNEVIDLSLLLPENSFEVIYSILNDTYESNKELAVKILKFIKHHKVSVKLNNIEQHMISVKPSDSITAAYTLQHYCHVLTGHEAKHVFEVAEIPNEYPTIYCALEWCIKTLNNGLELAKLSILKASKLNPMYGCLFVMKHLICELDFKKLQESVWRTFIRKLIIICKDLTKVVGPIVNSDSPEGHLPNDFSEMPIDITDNDSGALFRTEFKVFNNNENIADLKTTAQMVLLCGWRTVKEVSLILGEIVLKSMIENEQKDHKFLIEKSQMLEIGDHFKELLSETKHRGAFEQAYVGFLKLSTRLWRLKQIELNRLPMDWLIELVEIISNDEKVNEKICATRRSAGVPFIIQAIITSELQVGTTKSLQFCMNNLISICTDQDYSSEARTHALNILRALFRCTDLNESIGDYVADGVICSINGYDAKTWSEKNSTTLLFSALIVRIFGVQIFKNSDTLNIRNKMTGRIFFLRYPKLYDFFLIELRKASELIQMEQKANKLHPLLLMLCRLYPSALEGTESNLKLSALIPYVSVCSASSELTTRYLVAKAIVAFISTDLIVERVRILLATIHLSIFSNDLRSKNLNYLHGLLLQVRNNILAIF